MCKEQSFTDYLGKKFANYKRFGVEGLNATIGALGELVNVAVKEGTEYMVLGMASLRLVSIPMYTTLRRTGIVAL